MYENVERRREKTYVPNIWNDLTFNDEYLQCVHLPTDYNKQVTGKQQEVHQRNEAQISELQNVNSRPLMDSNIETFMNNPNNDWDWTIPPISEINTAHGRD